jgi:hypothetical protein
LSASLHKRIYITYQRFLFKIVEFSSGISIFVQTLSNSHF